jgi:hypothetical protein
MGAAGTGAGTNTGSGGDAHAGAAATRFANNSAAAVLLYIMTGKLLNFVFEEEF